MNFEGLTPRLVRFTLRQRRLAKRQLPQRLTGYRRRLLALALLAKRPPISRAEQRAINLAEREFRRLQEAEQRAEFENSKPTFE